MTEKHRILHPDIHRMNLDSYTSAFYEVVHDSWSIIMDSPEHPADEIENAQFLLTHSLQIGRSTFQLTDEEMVASCNTMWGKEQERLKTDPPRPI